jgi:hypothetical protein
MAHNLLSLSVIIILRSIIRTSFLKRCKQNFDHVRSAHAALDVGHEINDPDLIIDFYST